MAATRVGDQERERTAEDLALALRHGYLNLDEYDHRLQRAFAADTTDALHGVLGDLPAARLRRRAAAARAARLGMRIHLGAYLAGSVLMLAIWLAVGLTAGAWYFWPVWPILGWGMGVASHIAPTRMAFRKSQSVP
jgi:hypothetical protein